jgi:ornithine cyclodeaminase
VTLPVIGFADGQAGLDWLALTDALAAGHLLPRARIADTLLRRGDDTMLSRAAWIDGLGLAVKTATIFPGNLHAPTVNGGLMLYADADGVAEAVVDFHLVTKWKTAGDSLLAARRLARPDTERILLIGAGTVAASLRSAYAALFPAATFEVWSRTAATAAAFAALHDATAVADLPAAVTRADLTACATMATRPVLLGEWLRPGQHVDLIGAYRPDMREADDTAMARADLYVDARATTLDHIGEMIAPIASGAIAPDDVIADFYDVDAFARRSDDAITICKNGGGAHLDLMTARHILDRWRAR